MLERPGNVLYWTGCAAAVAVIAISAIVVSDAPHPIGQSA